MCVYTGKLPSFCVDISLACAIDAGLVSSAGCDSQSVQNSKREINVDLPPEMYSLHLHHPLSA